jgi:ABC-type Fe3+ transport system permease subunit
MRLAHRVLAAAALLGISVVLVLQVGTPIAVAFFDQSTTHNLRSIRPTLFHVGLCLSDPYPWECLRNSALFACVLTLGSGLVALLVLRVGAAASAHGCAWGALTSVSLAFPPVFVAVGLRNLAEWLSPLNAETPLFRWLSLLLTESLWSIPLVTTAISLAARRLGVGWEDAARACAGKAGRARAWHAVVRPLVRGPLLRASGLVLVLALLEPAGPLVFGLDRTLAALLVGAARFAQSDQTHATHALMAWCLTLAVLGCLRFFARLPAGNASVVPLGRRTALSVRPQMQGVHLRVQSMRFFFGLVWLAICSLPTLGCLGLLLRSAVEEPSPASQTTTTFSRFMGFVSTTLAEGTSLGAAVFLTNSLIIAGAAATLALAFAKGFSGLGIPRKRVTIISNMMRAPLLLSALAVLLFTQLLGADRAGVVMSTPLSLILPIVVLAWYLTPSFVAVLLRIDERTSRAQSDLTTMLGVPGVRAWWLNRGRLAIPAIARNWLAATLFAIFETGALLIFAQNTQVCSLGPASLILDITPGAHHFLALLALSGMALVTLARVAGLGQTWFDARLDLERG